VTISDDLGRYSLSYLWPGKYELSAAAPDFVTDVRAADIGAPAVMDITMRVISLGTCPGPECIGIRSIPPWTNVSKPRGNAERLAAELWQFAMRPEDTARTSEVDPRLRKVLTGFHDLGLMPSAR
jgi:hypothetical protein